MIPDGSTRVRHQCSGDLTASLSFTALGKSCPDALGSQDACEEDHVFGVGYEPYELAKVMACCDPFDPEISNIDEYLNYCAADMIQQICQTIATRLKQLIDDGKLPKTAESTALQGYVAENEGECYKALWLGNGASEPGQVVASWVVPNKPAWAAVLQNLTVTIEASAVTDVTLPADPFEYLECTGIQHNDDQIFEEESMAGVSEGLLLTSSASASVVAPPSLEWLVPGAVRLESSAAGCKGSLCSNASVTTDAFEDVWTLEDMNLFAENPIAVGNGPMNIIVERGSVRLYGTSDGRISRDPSGALLYEIPIRGAHFVVAGVSNIGVWLRVLSNSTPMTAHRSSSTWAFDAFSLEFIDSTGETWMLDVSATTWSRP